MNKFGFKPAAKELTTAPIGKVNPTDALKQAINGTAAAAAAASPNPNIPQTLGVKTEGPDLSVEDIGNLEIPTDDYEWDGQVYENPKEANEYMGRLLQGLEKSFGGDGVDAAMYRCLHFLEAHPFLKDILLPQDVGKMMRALAISTTEVVEKKTSNRKKKADSEQRQNAIMDKLSDFSI